ncbi:MAG: hypothetical protein L6Q57_00145 [Alphaproteobacteria bacterium]|nr:hypothetical protein [Alphaproteobacteria bacterium]
MISAMNTALSGLYAATQKVNQAANRIVQVGTDIPGADEIDLTAEAVNLKIGELSYKANVATLRTAEEMSDELLRIFDKRV